MESDLRELYQQIILDHGRKPRNFGDLEGANHSAEGYNPLCGDRIHVALHTDDSGRITGIRFKGSGCTICTASASLMTAAVEGKARSDAESMAEDFHRLVTTDETPQGLDDSLGKLSVFAGVREFPLRVKCATLPWHALRAALKDNDTPVSTE